jgi:prepilin-type N-terminal cleavage/methylation domain-containing protein
MKNNSQAGFTLIEILIAITLLSFVMMGVVAITGGSIETKDRVLSEDEQYLQVETAMSRLEWDISQTYSPLYFSHEMKPQNLSESQGDAYNQLIANYQNNNRFSFPSYDSLPVPVFKFEDKNTLTFFTTSNRRKLKNIKQSHFAWVQYTVESDDNAQNDSTSAKGMLVRKFMPHDVFHKEDIVWEDVKSQILLRNVDSLKFEFWNPKTRKWVDNLDLIEQGNHLFRGVKILLNWIDPDGIEVEIIRVFRPLFPNFKPEDMYKLELESDPEKDEGEETA